MCKERLTPLEDWSMDPELLARVRKQLADKEEAEKLKADEKKRKKDDK
jgi:hypothetical protein